MKKEAQKVEKASQPKQSKFNVSRVEATVALMILSAGTLYSFYELAADQTQVLYGAGVIIVYVCLRAVFKQFSK